MELEFELTEEDYIYIYISSLSAHVVPKRAFKNTNDQKEFFNEISRQIIK